MNHFTFYTIIGRDPEMFEAHVRNVKYHAGFDKIPCEKEFLAIVYTNPRIAPETTHRILELCAKYGVRPYLYEEPPSAPWLQNLYRCWNLGYEQAKPGHVFRSGSDQMWNRHGIVALCENAAFAKPNQIVWSNTVESGKRAPDTRHLTWESGDHPRDFNEEAFESYVAQLNMEARDRGLLSLAESLRLWGKPTPIHSPHFGPGHNRVEGVSWLMTTDLFNQLGPMPEHLVYGFTGDVIYADRMELAGYEHVIARDSVSFHYARGESEGIERTC